MENLSKRQKNDSAAPITISGSTALKVVRFYGIFSILLIVGGISVTYIQGAVTPSAAFVVLAKESLFVLVTAGALYLYLTRSLHAGLQESEVLRQRLSRLSRYANDIVLLTDEQGNILDANDRAAQAYGCTIAALRTMNLGQLYFEEQSWRHELETVLRQGSIFSETTNKRADGSQFSVELSARRIDLEGQTSIHCIVRDVSERKAVERQIIRLKDVYAALSHTNLSLIRLTTREELFQAICEIIIKYGRFRMAFIGLLPNSSGVVPLAAKAGVGLAYLDDFRVSSDPASPLSRGPFGRAISTGQFQVVNNLESSEVTRPWRESALKFGFRSSAAFPISTAGRVIGAISLYSGESAYFTQDLIDLLNEMAASITYALDRMESEAERKRLEAELQKSNARIQGIIEGSRDVIAAMDTQMRFTLCNRAFQDLVFGLVGASPHLGMTLDDCWRSMPSQLETSLEGWSLALKGERVSRSWSVGQGDSERFFESFLAPLLDPAGKVVGAFHVGRDVTARRKMESDLRKLSTAVEQSPVTVVITDSQGTIEYVNPAFTATSGYTAAEALGQNPRLLKSGKTDAAGYAEMWATIAGGSPWVGQFQNRRKDGSLYWEEAVIAPIRDAAGAITHFIGIKQDVTVRREAEERATFLAFHDPLTRLPNRHLGQERMEQAMKNAELAKGCAALLFIDIDHFKKVNDSLGHSVGDHLLQALVERLQTCVRPQDTLSRLGGDAFFLVVPSLEEPTAPCRLAERILSRTVQPFLIDRHEISITVSIGIAVYEQDGRDFDALFAQADAALHHGKNTGRNNFQFFTEKMKTDADEYLFILTGLRRGLERGEFVLHYQPQVELVTNTVVGSEALLRWNHPELGLVPPGRFISIAEDSGLIVELGEWVLRQACRQAAAWRESGKCDLPVAVNLSAVQFRRGNLPQIIGRALTDARLDPSRLELELTESILIDDATNALSVVQQLKALGVRLALDDFGTGYSNLAYLRRFQLDRLKIDRSFVSGVVDSQDDLAIVQTIIQMARTFGLRTIAEGVETTQTLEVIRRCGCDEVQGYFFGKPMSPQAFEQYLETTASAAEGPSNPAAIGTIFSVRSGSK